MGLQTIIDNATYISINKRKGSGLTVSRSGHVKTSFAQGSVYRFTVGMHAGLKYSTNRGLLEDLDALDRITESNISLNNNTGMNYVTAYQGDIAQAQLDNLTMVGSNGSELYIDQTGATGSGTLFKKGDYIQPQGNTGTYRYPYQVTSDVTFNSGSANTTISVHRPVLSQDGVALTSGGLRVGNDVRFHTIILNAPTYSIAPHDLIEFSDDFELLEVIT